MSLSVAEAHQRLTDAGIPLFAEPSCSCDDITSPEVERFGTTEGRTNVAGPGEPAWQRSASEPAPSVGLQSPGSESRSDDATQEDTGPPSAHAGGAGADHVPRGDDSASGGSSQKYSPQPRPQHKQEWDQRLLSYVKHKSQDADEAGRGESSDNEENLAIEIAARAAVCRYERERGREPEEMPQTHPGFDIISRKANHERRIEVKGLSGEWGLRGVSVSRLQFMNAQDFGDDYWLYVVEFASDPEKRRIYPIQDPAFKVASYMFDSNWRDIATLERPDPVCEFQPGVNIAHATYGPGAVEAVEQRGITRMLRVIFQTGGIRIIPIDLAQMRIVKSPDGRNGS